MKEMGGYLPLELRNGKEYYEKNCIALNSARNAICLAVADGEYKKIYLPIYLCESIKNTLEQNEIRYQYYHIDEEFVPILTDESIREIKQGKGCLLVVNYFGIFNKCKLRQLVDIYNNVIIDNTQAFYQEPIEDAYNVYSCRKFFGVSDGAYLIKNGIKPYELSKDYSSQRMCHLFSSMEYGTNQEYKRFLACEADIENSKISEMSIITKAILKNVDYRDVADKRRINYMILDKALGKYNPFICQLEERVPMIYPILVEDEELRETLIKNKIYVSQWWKWCIANGANEFEQKLSKYVIPLPLDQRYSTNDMEYLINVLERYLGEVMLWN